MDVEQFDRWTRGLNARLPRRSVTGTGIAASALALLGFGVGDVDAKNKKKKRKKRRKKKKKKNNPQPQPLPPVPPGANTSCQNLTTACGNTAICQCRIDKNSVQTCENIAIPPNGIAFVPCQSNVNCGPGEVCDAVASVCLSTCAT